MSFGVEDPKENPVHWDVGFETKDDDWLGITISFVGDMARNHDFIRWGHGDGAGCRYVARCLDRF
jgi:hypothetical protein